MCVKCSSRSESELESLVSGGPLPLTPAKDTLHTEQQVKKAESLSASKQHIKDLPPSSPPESIVRSREKEKDKERRYSNSTLSPPPLPPDARKSPPPKHDNYKDDSEEIR